MNLKKLNEFFEIVKKKNLCHSHHHNYKIIKNDFKYIKLNFIEKDHQIRLRCP